MEEPITREEDILVEAVEMEPPTDEGEEEEVEEEPTAEAEPVEGTEEEPVETGAEAHGKPPALDEAEQKLADIQKKIEEAEAKALEAEEKAKEWTDKKRRARKDFFEPEPTPEVEKETELGPQPTQDQFDTYEEYNDALVDWKVKQAMREQDASRRTDEQFRQLEEFRLETIDKGQQMYANFDEVVLDDTTLPITTEMIEQMMGLDHPEKVVYYLGKNRQECTKISRMPLSLAAVAMVKIEQKVLAAEADKPPIEDNPVENTETQTEEPEKAELEPETKPPPAAKSTQAPEPITPVTGGEATVTKEPEKMSPAEYRAWREKGGGFD